MFVREGLRLHTPVAVLWNAPFKNSYEKFLQLNFLQENLFTKSVTERPINSLQSFWKTSLHSRQL